MADDFTHVRKWLYKVPADHALVQRTADFLLNAMTGNNTQVDMAARLLILMKVQAMMLAGYAAATDQGADLVDGICRIYADALSGEVETFREALERDAARARRVTRAR